MKTTLELPDELFRQAKATAASTGKSLKDFFTEALKAKLERLDLNSPKPWMRHFGSLSELGSEREAIESYIDAEFESIPRDEWK